ncbi:hypothetical protein EV128_102169 [Rhizobium azibense]|nr:hypothetical protein EV128_102169 [Rhizobium azibense]
MLVYRTGVACFCVRNLPRYKENGPLQGWRPVPGSVAVNSDSRPLYRTSCLRGAFAHANAQWRRLASSTAQPKRHAS